jgi:surface polysaccharide O-acyltransferase-like enzyme
MFLSYVHSLRAVAILSIVAFHCIALFAKEPLCWQEPLIRSLVSNGTILFVFVAGFLFQHLSYKFEYRRYLKSKLQNVLLPYVFVSLPIIAYEAIKHYGTFSPNYIHHWPTAAQNFAWALLTGTHIMGPFWFIPMIAVFYVLAPVFLRIDRDGRSYYLLPVLLTVTVFVHRPRDLDHIWHSFTYYLPVYLYGMWFSHHRDRVLAWHDRWLPALLTLVAGLAWLEVWYLQRAGVIFSAGMFSTESGGLDVDALQKLLLCGVLLSVLRRHGGGLHRKLSLLADTSFGIYFLHQFIINGFSHLVAWRAIPIVCKWSYLPIVAAVAAVVSICVCCLLLARQVLGRHSRKFVGF